MECIALFFRFTSYLKNLAISTNPFLFMLISLVLSYLVVVPQGVVTLLLGVSETGSGGPSIETFGLIPAIIITGIVAPIVETFLCQWVPIKLIRLISKVNDNYVIIASAFIFGIMHGYNVYYVIYAFAIGLVFAFSFIVYSDGNRKAFLYVAALHSIRNNIATLVMFVAMH